LSHLLTCRVNNDGRGAANGGFGVRYIGNSQVWGINTYYDFRHTTRRSYNQYGLGLECLGRVFDFRINGYLPFGKKQSSYYDTKFDHFKGNSLILSRKRELSFKGANAEVGAHVKLAKHFYLYAATGPYFIDHGSRNAWGGELRIALDLTKYVRVEGNVSYDRIFKGIGQGQLSLNAPFGAKQKIHRRKTNSCSREIMLRHRAVQRVDRDEIIVVEKRRTHAVATDPATGLPLFFVFVNNTSHSLGTFESPFPTLTQAQANSAPGNIILVSSGNGSPYADQPITLQNNQKLWGTGISYRLHTQQGNVTIPIMSAFPTISASSATFVAVTLANGNEVAGLNFANIKNNSIVGGNSNLAAIGITNANIHDNFFSGVGEANIGLYNCSGVLQIANNQMTTPNDDVIDIANANFPINSNVTIANNTISGSGGTGISVEAEATSGQMYLTVTNNNVSGSASNNFTLSEDAGTAQNVCATVANNTFTNSVSGAGFLIINGSSGKFNVAVSGNTFTGNSTGGFEDITTGGTTCVSLNFNNSVNNSTNAGYFLRNVTGTLQVENLANISSNNIGTVTQSGTITSVPVGNCSCQ